MLGRTQARPPHLMQLNQVTVPALDIPASVAFYRGLGLRLIVSSPHYARFECPDGGSTFSVHLAEDLAPHADTVVYFECQDLDQKVSHLKGKGYSFIQEPQDQPWLWREARLRDPANNQVCLYWAGENRRFPPWRVPE
jgi:catechol 2,3-dioxygenase-like lactoylglutathione lyase family enzyme